MTRMVRNLAIIVLGSISIFGVLQVIPRDDNLKCGEVWAHAGRYSGLEKNSLRSIKAVFDAGAKGAEIDIFYLPEFGGFIVQHDHPKTVGPKNVTLDLVFKHLGNRGMFWLDFKNLGILNTEQTRNMRSALMEIIRRGPGVSNVIVESTSAKNLAILSKGGLRTSFWIATSNGGILDSAKKLLRQRYYYHTEKFEFISFDSSEYSFLMKFIFTSIPKLMFTVNDTEKIRNYFTDRTVQIILSDEKLYELDLAACN